MSDITSAAAARKVAAEAASEPRRDDIGTLKARAKSRENLAEAELLREQFEALLLKGGRHSTEMEQARLRLKECFMWVRAHFEGM
jgi:hypothetical protein